MPVLRPADFEKGTGVQALRPGGGAIGSERYFRSGTTPRPVSRNRRTPYCAVAWKQSCGRPPARAGHNPTVQVDIGTSQQDEARCVRSGCRAGHGHLGGVYFSEQKAHREQERAEKALQEEQQRQEHLEAEAERNRQAEEEAREQRIEAEKRAQLQALQAQPCEESITNSPPEVYVMLRQREAGILANTLMRHLGGDVIDGSAVGPRSEFLVLRYSPAEGKYVEGVMAKVAGEAAFGDEACKLAFRSIAGVEVGSGVSSLKFYYFVTRGGLVAASDKQLNRIQMNAEFGGLNQ